MKAFLGTGMKIKYIVAKMLDRSGANPCRACQIISKNVVVFVAIRNCFPTINCIHYLFNNQILILFCEMVTHNLSFLI